MHKFTKTAIVVATVGALVAPASAAFAANKTERAIIGALIGGVAGAAVGDGKTEAVAIGAVAGAALGASTGKSNKRYGHGYRSNPRYENSRYYDNRYDRGGYRNDRYDARYGYGYRR